MALAYGTDGRRLNSFAGLIEVAAVYGLRHHLIRASLVGDCLKCLDRTRLIIVKRRDVIEKLRAEAKRKGLDFHLVELTNHTGVVVDGLRSTLARHTEVPDITARKFFDQFSDKLGKGWWR